MAQKVWILKITHHTSRSGFHRKFELNFTELFTSIRVDHESHILRFIYT